MCYRYISKYTGCPHDHNEDELCLDRCFLWGSKQIPIPTLGRCFKCEARRTTPSLERRSECGEHYFTERGIVEIDTPRLERCSRCKERHSTERGTEDNTTGKNGEKLESE